MNDWLKTVLQDSIKLNVFSFPSFSVCQLSYKTKISLVTFHKTFYFLVCMALIQHWLLFHFTILYYWLHMYQCCNEASKIFVLRRFLAEDPSSSSSSAHFQKSKNLRSFEDFRPKIPKIFKKKSSFVEEILRENGRKYVGLFFG